jgi:hypothetical protein
MLSAQTLALLDLVNEELTEQSTKRTLGSL